MKDFLPFGCGHGTRKVYFVQREELRRKYGFVLLRSILSLGQKSKITLVNGTTPSVILYNGLDALYRFVEAKKL